MVRRTVSVISGKLIFRFTKASTAISLAAFNTAGRVPPTSPAWRARSFDEVDIGYTEAQAVAEARRCLSCGLCSDCHMCAEACEAGAIDFGLREEHREVKVGAVVHV